MGRYDYGEPDSGETRAPRLLRPAPTAVPVEAPQVPLEMLASLGERDASEVLDLAEAALAARRGGDVAELRVAYAWAVLHGEPVGDRDPMTCPGGEGTPAVREYALPELAMARQTHTSTTRALLADALDLVHRLPRVWAKVVALGCEAWVARKVAVRTRHLPAEAMPVVDAAIAAVICGHSPATVFEVTEAAVIDADPEAHARRREQARHERYATFSRCDEFGYRTLLARVTAGDAAYLDALLERVVDILTLEHGEDHNHSELRAMALGWLARPADLLQLLLEHTEPGADLDEPDEPRDRRPVWCPSHLDRTLGRLAQLSTAQLAALRGKGVVFVHTTVDQLTLQAGVARVEGVGPVLVQCLGEVLGHADVRLMPVVDLNAPIRADAYEHSERLKDHVWLQSGGETFPFAARTATRGEVDFDHALSYRFSGRDGPDDPRPPPRQTGSHNSQPLRRTQHRWKTHGGYRTRPAGPGRYLWATPHGRYYLVDRHGTRRLADEHARMMLAAPPGVDVYPGVRLVLECGELRR